MAALYGGEAGEEEGNGRVAAALQTPRRRVDAGHVEVGESLAENDVSGC